MTRTYVKSKRADNQAETRQRIAEAAFALHGEVGPNATTVSLVAERAGVQRHTVYAHYADEKSLLMACSALHLEQQPPPAPDQWADISDPGDRLTAALTALYQWFARNQSIVGKVLRDAEINEPLKEVSELRFGPVFGAIFESVSNGLDANARAVLHLAISFYTWRTLVLDAGLSAGTAAALMSNAVLGTGRSE